MKGLPTLERLTLSFSRLPGIGQKSAERLAHAVLRMKEEDREEFAKCLSDVGKRISKCPVCGLYMEGEACPYCNDETRDASTLCVVSDSKDANSIEASGYNGMYHVLGGLISPSKGLMPDGIGVDALLRRVEEGDFKEVVLAFSPTMEGETTSLYVAKILEKTNVNVTRLGYGLPMGSSIDYADGLTLEKAFEGRRKI